MINLKQISYDTNIKLDSALQYNGMPQRIYLSKTFFKMKQTDQYFLKLFYISQGNLLCQGYIYFYLDFDKQESKFIGIYIKPEYRNHGLASLLVAMWARICLENNIHYLSTNKKQRKPFLLYILKKYGFELTDTSLYSSSNQTIYICQNTLDTQKCLYIPNSNFLATFHSSSILLNDNYVFLPNITKECPILDQVLLSYPYYLQDNNQAYKRALSIEKSHY